MTLNERDFRVLLCRVAPHSDFLATQLEAVGITVDTFSPASIRYLNPTEIAEELKLLIERKGYLIFSSANGIKAFKQHSALVMPLIDVPDCVRVALAGKRTKDVWNNEFPDIASEIKGSYLQDVLDNISTENRKQDPVSVLHMTSRNSIETLSPIVANKLLLKRVAIYETVCADQIDQHDLPLYSADLIFFGSPSAYQCFSLHPQASKYISKTGVAVLGETTASYLRKRSIGVDIIPEAPTVINLVKSVKKYRMNMITNENEDKNVK